MSIRIASTLSLAMLLAACGNEPAEPAPIDGERTAEGDVLGGTISDEMLPLDTVRSQAPSLKDTGEAVDDDEASSDGSSPQAASAPQAAAESASDESDSEEPAEAAEE